MLRIYNTMSRRKEDFFPRAPPVVKFFTCGPSIYQRPHLGNYRTFLYEDILERYLGYRGYHVERVLPFTDIEDKALAQAEKEGVSLSDLTARVAEEFFREACLLRMKPPTYNPRSSTTIEYAVEIIERLLGKGIAYHYGPDIYFDPLKFPGLGSSSAWTCPGGRRRRSTSGRTPTRASSGTTGTLSSGTGSGRVTPWSGRHGSGRGGPRGMSRTGDGHPVPREFHRYPLPGIDNLYRHHDYNLAIVESLTGREYARYWMHGGHLLLDGKKMSKSRGNIVYLPDLTSRGCTPEEVRFFLTYGHYRDRMNMNDENLSKAREVLRDLKAMITRISEVPGNLPRKPRDAPVAQSLEEGFRERMDDDLDVRGAVDWIIGSLGDIAARKAGRGLSSGEAGAALTALRRVDDILQVIFPPGTAPGSGEEQE